MRGSREPRRRLLLLASTVALAVAASAASAHAAAKSSAAPKSYSIAPQDLKGALQQFGLQSGETIIFRAEVVGGARSPGAVGRFESEAALAALLKGSGLSFVRAEQGFIIVAPSRADPPAQAVRAEARPAPPPPALPETSTAANPVEGIVVTGSRVILNGNHLPTPVTIVGAEELTQATPRPVVDALLQLPVFAGGRSPTTNPGNSSQNFAARVLNLRSVGITRTLVLFDGRRVAPTLPTGEVNADFVPSMLLDRIDIVTGGVSAVYGSDAVAGVVNFITDRNFNGVKFDARYGVSELGDGQETQIGVAAGTDILGGRGHIEGSYEHYDSPGIFSKLNRDWGRRVWTVQGAGTVPNPYRLVENTRLSSTSFLGLIRSGPLADQVFRGPGVLGPFQHGAPTGGMGVESGGDGGYYFNASLQSLYESDLAFGRLDYDLTPDVHFYAQAMGMLSHNMNNHETNEFRNITLSSTNAFLAPEHQQAMTSQGVDSFVFSKMMRQAPVKQPESFTRGFMATVGLEGKLGRWTWDVSYSASKNQQRTRNNANPDNQRAAAALDAVRAPDGRIVCNVELTHPGLYPGCVPLNLFGPGSESPEALDYVLAVTKYRANTSLDNLGGSITGSPFSTPAGEVRAALSAEWRKLTYSQVSNAQPLPADCTGLRFNCRQGTTLLFQSNVLADRSPVTQTVKEIAGEVSVPLLAGARFAESVNFNGAARLTDYDTSGTVTAWKLGLDWRVNSQLTLRATHSQDIRAPNLNELYAPRLINPAGVTDRHTGIVGQAPLIIDPNPDLEVEVAKTWTAGFVFRPNFIPRLSLAVDWYKISIGNAITTIQGLDPTIQNTCEASNGTSPFCALIERPLPFSDRSPANFATAFYSRPQNAQTLDTHGLDFEVNYQAPLWGGELSLRALATYQPDLVTVRYPGAPELNFADAPGLSTWRMTAFAKYTYRNVSLDVQQRWMRGTGWNPDRALIYAEDRLPSVAYTNATLSYQLGRTQFYASVQNLFDKQPSVYGAVGGNSGVPGLFGGFIPGEDPVGRYFTVGLRYRRSFSPRTP